MEPTQFTSEYFEECRLQGTNSVVKVSGRGEGGDDQQLSSSLYYEVITATLLNQKY